MNIYISYDKNNLQCVYSTLHASWMKLNEVDEIDEVEWSWMKLMKLNEVDEVEWSWMKLMKLNEVEAYLVVESSTGGREPPALSYIAPPTTSCCSVGCDMVDPPPRTQCTWKSSSTWSFSWCGAGPVFIKPHIYYVHLKSAVRSHRGSYSS